MAWLSLQDLFPAMMTIRIGQALKAICLKLLKNMSL